MKVYFSDSGDYSVGIGNLDITLDVNMSAESVDREGFRQAFKEFCNDWFDPIGETDSEGRIGQVVFGDECGTCGALLDEKGICPNKGCQPGH